VGNLAGPIATGDVNPGSDGGRRREFVLAFAGAPVVWVYTSTGEQDLTSVTLVPQLLQEVSLPAGSRVRRGARLADVDGNGALDLLISITDAAGMSRVAVTYNAGSSLAAQAGTEPAFESFADPWPLAAGDLDGDGKADYVLRGAIVLTDVGSNPPPLGPPGVLQPVAFASTQSWEEAVLADFNGDGAVDVATSVEAVEGLDFFLGTGTGLFNKFRVNTAAPPQRLRAGDFDGDFVADLAFAEIGFGIVADRLSVAFGARSGGPSRPMFMGSPGIIEAIEPLSYIDSLDAIDVIADLMVLTASFPERSDRAVSVLQGSSSRRMVSPFPFRPPQAEYSDVPRQLQVGRFTASAHTTRDVVSIARPARRQADDTALVTPHFWMVPAGRGTGALDGQKAAYRDLSPSTFDGDCAVWTVGDLDPGGDGLEELIGVDGGGSCYPLGGAPGPRFLVARATGSGVLEPTFGALPEELRRPVRLQLHDLDGDGDRDLLAVFAGDGASGAGIAVLWNEGGTLDPARSSRLGSPDWTGVGGVVPIDASPDRVPELAVLAGGRLHLASFERDTGAYAQPAALDQLPEGDRRLRTGDLNGDGLGDLVYMLADRVNVLLAIPAAPLGSTGATGGEP
jgi:hypothetical protein